MDHVPAHIEHADVCRNHKLLQLVAVRKSTSVGWLLWFRAVETGQEYADLCRRSFQDDGMAAARIIS
jgi:hypothetical protein